MPETKASQKQFFGESYSQLRCINVKTWGLGIMTELTNLLGGAAFGAILMICAIMLSGGF